MNSFDEMVEAVSRTFALSIKSLPARLKRPVGLAYLLFRVSDCFEDHPELGVDEKADLLVTWERVLRGEIEARVLTRRIVYLDGNQPEVYVAQKAGELIELLNSFEHDLRDMIIARCSESALGMARWQQLGPLVETELQLDDYMHQVAGLVGYLMTDIYAWYYPALAKKKQLLLPIAREVGLGLQTVNVIRGLRSDYQRGWMFIPKEYLDQVKISCEQFFQPEYESQAMMIVGKLADKAERHLKYGISFIEAFPSYLLRPRLANIWPLFFAMKTLSLSRNNLETVRSEVKISREDVKQIMHITSLRGWSNRWLVNYFNSFANDRI